MFVCRIFACSFFMPFYNKNPTKMAERKKNYTASLPGKEVLLLSDHRQVGCSDHLPQPVYFV